jgi:hypothetical protein
MNPKQLLRPYDNYLRVTGNPEVERQLTGNGFRLTECQVDSSPLT